MRIRRLAIATVAVGAILGAGGCGDSGNGSGTTAGAPAATTAAATTTPADPKAELAATYAKFAETTVKFKTTAAGGVAIDGAIDGRTKAADMKTAVGASGSMATRQVGTDLYVKADGQMGSAIGAAAGKWMHIDMSTVPDSSPISVKNSDPANTAKMLSYTDGVTKTGDRAFKGTLDMTKSPTANSAQLKALGTKATKVPFTAATDEQGRLTEFTIDLETIAPGAGKMTATYYDYGAPVDVKAPAASEVVEMPAKFRKAMGA